MEKPKRNMKELGRRGGMAVSKGRGAEHMRQIARHGGDMLRETRGADHFAEIGRKGGLATGRQEGAAAAAGRRGGFARARSRRINAALQPFCGWLEEQAATMKRMLLQDAGAADLPCLTPFQGPPITYGDCARLLSEMKGAGLVPLQPPTNAAKLGGEFPMCVPHNVANCAQCLPELAGGVP